MDNELFGIDDLIDFYNSVYSDMWRRPDFYKFWEYAITNTLMEYERGKIGKILNISDLPDRAFTILFEHKGYVVKNVYPEEALYMPIYENKYDLVTAFGVFDRFKNKKRRLTYFKKFMKHVNVDGFAFISSDDTDSDMTAQELLFMSQVVEPIGYSLYDQDNIDIIDYKFDYKGLHSLIMERIGR